MKQWFFDRLIVEKFNNLFGFITLLLLCVFLAVAIASLGLTGGVAVFGVVLCIPIVFLSLRNNAFGYLFLMIFSTFMALLSRVFRTDFPWGAGIDVLLGLMFIGVIARQILSNDPDKGKEFSLSNPISVIVLIWSAYLLLQVFNPAGTLSGWLFGLRDIFRMLMIFIIAQGVFKNMKAVNTLVMTFVVLGLITALYGIYQEYVGLPPHDLEWATSSPQRINLLFIQQRWRKFSVVSDPGIYGLFMSFGSLLALILSLGSGFGWKKRTFFFISGILMLFAMVFSGTRTAYAIIPAGVAIYVLLNITSVKTLAFACVSAMIFVALIFGPFYGKVARRIRSAFTPEDDASMNLRDANRQKVQPYIYEHPIGGGLTTTGGYGEQYSPGHPMAGFPPDSGFLETLLEAGWIGFLLELTMYSIVLAVGVNNYYNTRDPVLKMYYAAFTASFFALTIALYAKDRIDQFPLNFVIYGIFVLMYKMKNFDKAPTRKINDEEY